MSILTPLARLFDGLARYAPMLARDERGATATMLGFAMLPIMAMSGAAIDYNTVSRTRSILQQSVDSAVLAGASAVAQGQTDTNGDITAAVKNYITANFSNTQHLNPSTLVAIDASGVVTATVTLDVPLKIMPVLGMDTTQIKITSKAAYGTGGNAEVALVFDTTYSMVGAKL